MNSSNLKRGVALIVFLVFVGWSGYGLAHSKPHKLAPQEPTAAKVCEVERPTAVVFGSVYCRTQGN